MFFISRIMLRISWKDILIKYLLGIVNSEYCVEGDFEGCFAVSYRFPRFGGILVYDHIWNLLIVKSQTSLKVETHYEFIISKSKRFLVF